MILSTIAKNGTINYKNSFDNFCDLVNKRTEFITNILKISKDFKYRYTIKNINNKWILHIKVYE